MTNRQVDFYGSDFGVNPNNPHGLQLQLVSEQDGEWIRVTGETIVADHFEGPPGHVHGGISFAILDEAMGRVSHVNGFKSLSATMTIDWHTPTPLNTPLRIEAWVLNTKGNKAFTESAIFLPDGKKAVSATGLYIARPDLFDKLIAEKQKRSEQ